MPATTTEIEAAILANLRLEGEEVRRIPSGKPAPGTINGHGYRIIRLRVRRGVFINVPLHRVKFLLAYGWLPPMVDHRDGNRGNDTLENLRAADATTNGRNGRSRRSLPRGVYFKRDRKAKPWVALPHGPDGKTVYLGHYATPEDASREVEAFLRQFHGEFYRARPKAAT